MFSPATDRKREYDGIKSLGRSNVYFVFPAAPLALGSQKIRELIAVQNLLAKTDSASHGHEVLEAKLTRLRRELREEFERAFGNEGLRAGTEVMRAGDPPTVVQINSWNEFLPAISRDLDSECPHQIRVRCGSYNEWQTGSRWSPIEKVIERVIQFDDHTPYQAEYLEFNETSQEAAIVDGVLVENGFLTENALTKKWELIRPSPDASSEILREILRHFQTGGSSDKEFGRLYTKLVEPPYSIPNGVIPILVSLVFRAEPSKIGVYERSGGQLQRVSDAQLPTALVGMARSPERYTTRYTKLTGKQRFVFKAIGPEMAVPYSDRVATGERFYEYCEQVRSVLKSWAAVLPEGSLAIPELTDCQKKLLKILRTAVPPQLPFLADHLVQVIEEDPGTREEVADAGVRLSAFPQTVRLWRDLRTKISRYVEGVKAPVRSAIREVSRLKPDETRMDLSRVIQAMKPLERLVPGSTPISEIVKRLSSASDAGDDVVEKVAAAIANKSPANLTDEDFGRAAGVLEMAAAMGIDDKPTILLPDCERRTLLPVTHPEAKGRIESDVRAWHDTFGLSPDQMAALAIDAIYTPAAVSDGQEVSGNPVRPQPESSEVPTATQAQESA